MIPTTAVGKVIGGVVAFTGICAVALPVGIVSSGFIDELSRKKKQANARTDMRSCPHCGGSMDS
jgi:voltage-gated potassium channel